MIYIFLAEGFEEIEAISTLDILRRAELDVQTVGVSGKTVAGAHGTPVVCDITQEEISLDGLEMVVLPGGMPGTLNLEKSEIVQTTIDFAVNNGLWLGAICAAPSILGHKELLGGKQVTCYPGFETQLGAGAVHKTDRVVKDGKLITGKGPGAAVEFALALVEAMAGASRAQSVRDALQ